MKKLISPEKPAQVRSAFPRVRPPFGRFEGAEPLLKALITHERRTRLPAKR